MKFEAPDQGNRKVVGGSPDEFGGVEYAPRPTCCPLHLGMFHCASVQALTSCVLCTCGCSTAFHAGPHVLRPLHLGVFHCVSGRPARPAVLCTWGCSTALQAGPHPALQAGPLGLFINEFLAGWITHPVLQAVLCTWGCSTALQAGPHPALQAGPLGWFIDAFGGV